MQKLRQHCSAEFLTIVDQVMICELDSLQDDQTGVEQTEIMKINIMAEISEETMKVKMSLEEAVEMQKMSMINNMVKSLSHSVCTHHEVFQGLKGIPECILQETLVLKIYPLVE